MEHLLIFSAPSGAGKTTIVNYLLAQFPQLSFSISATSRPRRGDEKDGEHYYFMSEKEFRNKIAANEFVEWEEVYPNQFYGTLKSEVKRIWRNHKVVVFDVDVIGGLNIKELYGDKAKAIFISPPSIKHLEKRLRERGTESEESIKKRIEKAGMELTYGNRFDEVLINTDLDKAKADAEEIVKGFLNL
ncbi:MAG TPA: guanylate kinase [Bacteroidales bacterium]|nr:guanylate kinase [Bacteroidales bacterium]